MNFVIKVADFGLAESMDTTKEYYRQNEDVIIKLPIKWLALESTMDGLFSEKSDVVSVYNYKIRVPQRLICTWPSIFDESLSWNDNGKLGLSMYTYTTHAH